MIGKDVGATTAVTMPIPALDGKSVAKTVTVEVPCTIDRVTGEEILGPEALETMDWVKGCVMAGNGALTTDCHTLGIDVRFAPKHAAELMK